MPYATLLVVLGSWLVLVGLTLVAWRFNRDRGHD